jgi:hypothetical protein
MSPFQKKGYISVKSRSDRIAPKGPSRLLHTENVCRETGEFSAQIVFLQFAIQGALADPEIFCHPAAVTGVTVE